MKRKIQEPLLKKTLKTTTNLICSSEEDGWPELRAFFSVLCPFLTCELGTAWSESVSETTVKKEKSYIKDFKELPS